MENFRPYDQTKKLKLLKTTGQTAPDQIKLSAASHATLDAPSSVVFHDQVHEVFHELLPEVGVGVRVVAGAEVAGVEAGTEVGGVATKGLGVGDGDGVGDGVGVMQVQLLG